MTNIKYEKILAKRFKKHLQHKKSFEDAAIHCIKDLTKLFFKNNLNARKTLLPVLYAAVRGYSISMAVKYLKERGFDVHCHQTVLEKIGYLKSFEISKFFELWRSVIFRVLRSFGFHRRRCLLAIDYHDKLFYGDKNIPEIIGREYKNGTKYAYRYATICILEEGIRFNLGCIPVTLFSIKEKTVKRLLDMAIPHVKVGCVLLDRGFNKVEVFRVIGNRKFIMPLVKYTSIEKIIKQGIDYLEALDYSFYKGTSKETKLRLIVRRIKKEHVWITNIKGSDHTLLLTIMEVYRKRWGIETGYVKANEFYSVTTSKKFSTRCFLTQLSFTLQDLWVMKNFIAYAGTKYQQPRILLVKISRKIVDFLGAFTKKLGFYWRPKTPAKIFCDFMKDRIEVMLPR